jgi:hypothetical protein
VVDRSAGGVELTRRACAEEIAAGLLEVRLGTIEEVSLEPDERPYDLAFACRVGSLDGRHPSRLSAAVTALRALLVPGAPILVDTGDPLQRLEEDPKPRNPSD